MPDFGKLPKLVHINLEATGLADIPDSLLTAVERDRVNLSGNAITEIPDAAFKLSANVAGAYDLSRNPLSRSALLQIKHYCLRTGEFFQADAPTDLQNRIKALYPTFVTAEANQFFFALPGDLDATGPALDRLDAEYATLRSDLQEWALNVPQRHPLRDVPLDEQTRAQEQLSRHTFKTLLEDAWRRETDLDEEHDSPEPTHKLTFGTGILGDLPHLRARFDHISSLELEGDGSTRGLDGLLKSLPGLRSLVISKFNLGEIPPTVFALSRLSTLSLTESAVRLTPASVNALAGMKHLAYLDLSENPLGLTPDVSHLNALECLYLQNCGLSEVPFGLFDRPYLRTVDLSDNLITQVPDDILSMRQPWDDESDLSGNPLSEGSLDHLRQYFRQTGNDLQVDAAGLNAQGAPLTPPSTPEPMEE
ncbi:MAG: hypothetical protein MUW57_23645 [Pseudomonas sp.]|nr:hypothetical protein [Pseudomonas sp.]